MLRKTYDMTLALAARPNAIWWLAGVAFIESSIFPISPVILLAPMVLAERHRAWLFATVCTVASVLGGLAGYAIGVFLFESIGRPLLDLYGYGDRFAEFQDLYRQWGAWIVAFAGATPFPYKVITIASGVVSLNLVVFLVASLLSRALQFFLVAALLWGFGPPLRRFVERHLGVVTLAFTVLLVGGFVAAKYLF